MSRTTLWIILVAGIVGLVLTFQWLNKQTPAPLNASGYTYPGSPGA